MWIVRSVPVQRMSLKIVVVCCFLLSAQKKSETRHLLKRVKREHNE
jgi:hypothetical protein